MQAVCAVVLVALGAVCLADEGKFAKAAGWSYMLLAVLALFS